MTTFRIWNRKENTICISTMRCCVLQGKLYNSKEKEQIIILHITSLNPIYNTASVR